MHIKHKWGLWSEQDRDVIFVGGPPGVARVWGNKPYLHRKCEKCRKVQKAEA
jgi:hypothetical protein